MRMPRRVLLCAWLAVCGSFTATSQQLALRHFTVADGLPAPFCAVLLQDSRGFLWLGSPEGFTAFDGTTFSTFTKAHGFDNIPPWIAAEDSTGTLWVGGRRGLTRVTRSPRFPLQVSFDELTDAGVRLEEPTAMVGTPHGTVLVATHQHIFEVHGTRLNRVLLVGDAGSGRIHDGYFGRPPQAVRPSEKAGAILMLAFDPWGRLVIATSNSLYRGERAGTADSLSWIRIRHLATVRGDDALPLYHVLVDHRGWIWYSTSDHALFVIDTSGTRFTVPSRAHGMTTISALYEDPHHVIWIGGEKSLHRVTVRDGPPGEVLPELSVETTTHANGLPKPGPFYGFLHDQSGNLWFSAWFNGILRLGRGTIAALDSSDLGLSAPDRLSEDAAGRVWVCGGGLARLDVRPVEGHEGPPVVAVRRTGGARGKHISDIVWLESDSMVVWDGFRMGIAGSGLEGGDSIRPLTVEPDKGDLASHLRTAALQCMLRDRQGYLWLSVQGFGVAQCSLRHNSLVVLRRLSETDGLADNSIRVMLQTRDGALWFGGYGGGLSRYDGQSLRTFTEADGLPDNSVRALCEARSGTLWVGTRYNGLCAYRDGAFRRYPAYDAVGTAEIWSIVEDSAGTLWMGTGRGLKAFLPDSALARQPEVRYFDRRDGIAEGAVHRLHLDRSGMLYCTSGSGAFVLDTRRPFRDPSVARVVLTSIEVNGVELTDSGRLDLAPSDNTISFAFQSVDISGGNPVRFRYMLDGLDSRWSDPTTSRKITFGRLPPGSYTFRVRIATTARRDSLPQAESPAPAVASVAFTIASPLWQRWWFVTLLVAAGAALAAALYNYRVGYLLRIERLRSKIAVDLHDDIGASLARVAAFSDRARRIVQNLSRQGGTRGEDSATLHDILEEIGTTSRDLIGAMSDIVWAVDPRNDSFDNVALRMKTYASRLLEAKGIDYELAVSDELSALRLPIEFRRDLFLIFKEALSNVVRHSHATRVELVLGREGQGIVMKLRDNGVGFDPHRTTRGSGLNNMSRRALSRNGSVSVDSTPQGGTMLSVHLAIP